MGGWVATETWNDARLLFQRCDVWDVEAPEQSRPRGVNAGVPRCVFVAPLRITPALRNSPHVFRMLASENRDVLHTLCGGRSR